MIKQIILSASLLTIFAFAKAQKAEAFALGPKVGMSLYKIDGTAFTDDFTWGYHVGGQATLNFGQKKRWGIQPEMLFSQVNTKTSEEISNPLDGVTDIKLSYLQIPLLLSFNTGKALSLQAGPQFGIMLNEENDFGENLENAFTKGDFGLVGGVQLALGNFRIYGRYVVGLSDMSDIKNSESWKNQTVQAGLAWMIF